jgi:hypothetical protein
VTASPTEPDRLRHGYTNALEGRPEEILFEVGRVGRTLHELDPRAAYEYTEGSVPRLEATERFRE